MTRSRQAELVGPGPVEVFDAAAWDDCVDRAGAFALLSAGALSAYEQGEPGKVPCHLVARVERRTVAIAPLFEESWRSPHARDMARRVPQPDALTATATVRWGVGFAVTCGGPVAVDGPGGSGGLAVLAGRMESWAAGGTVTGFTNVPQSVRGLALLAERGWQVVEQDVEHVLDAVAGGIEEHLARLPGSRGRNLRRSLRRVEDEEVLIRPAVAADLPLLERLMAEDGEAHDLLRALVPFSLVAHLVTDERAGDVRIARRRGEVVAYGVALRGRGRTWLLAAGARPPFVDQLHALYLDYLGRLRPGEKLCCGRENFVFKDRLGCRRVPMYAAFTGPDELGHVVKGWLGAMLPAVLGRARASFEDAGFPLPADLAARCP